MARFCSECGAQQLPENVFCESCGVQLPKRAEASTPGAAIAGRPRAMRLGRRRPPSARAMLLTGAVLATLVLAGGGYQLWRTDSLPFVSAKSNGGLALKIDVVPARFGEKCGYVNNKGKLVINPQFDYASPFTVFGQAAVRVASGWGVIDQKGKFVVDPRFDEIGFGDVMGQTSGGQRHWPVRLGSKWGLLNSRGEIIVDPQYDGIYSDHSSPGLWRVEQDSQMGLIDSRGKFVIEPQFQTISVFDRRDISWVTSGGKTGFIDRKGSYVIPPQFDETALVMKPDGDFVFFVKGLMPARTGDKWGLIDEQGAWRINPRFDGAGPLAENGLFPVAVDVQEQVVETDYFGFERTTTRTRRSWGYANTAGAIAVTAKFEEAGRFAANGLARVKVDGLWGYVDASGTFRVKPSFVNAFDFEDVSGGSRAIVAVQDDVSGESRVGMIDQTGTFLVQPKYTDITSLGRAGLYAVRDGNQLGIIDASGKVIAQPRYSQVALLQSGDFFYSRPMVEGNDAGMLEMGRMGRSGKVLTTVRAAACSL